MATFFLSFFHKVRRIMGRGEGLRGLHSAVDIDSDPSETGDCRVAHQSCRVIRCFDSCRTPRGSMSVCVSETYTDAHTHTHTHTRTIVTAGRTCSAEVSKLF